MKTIKNKVELYLKDAWSQGEQPTVADVAGYCFPNKSPLEARGAVHSYLFGLRNRKDALNIFPVDRGGKLVDMADDETEDVEVRLITQRHVNDIQQRWTNTKNRTENPLIVTKVGLQLLQEFTILGMGILNDLQQINKLTTGTEGARLEGRQEPAKNIL